MRQVIDEFVSILSYEVDGAGLRKFIKGIDKATTATVGMLSAIAVGVGGLLAGTAALNKEIAQQVALAESTQQNVDTLAALAGSVASLGFEYEHINSLAEEFNNKIGESRGLKALTPVKESLQIIGLKFKEIKDLKPEEQFEKVLDALIKMDDQQKASSAADILLGGEASRIIGFLNAQNDSLSEILEKHKALNLETKESRKGALEYSAAWGTFMKLLDSSKRLFSGLLGASLKGYLEKMTEWVMLNKEVVQSKIGTAIKAVKAGFDAMINTLKAARFSLGYLADAFGVSSKKMLAMIAVMWIMARHPLFAFIVGLVFVIDDLVTYMQGGESVTGKLIEKFNSLGAVTKALTATLVAMIGSGVIMWLLKVTKVLALTQIALRGIAVAAAFIMSPIGLVIAAVIGLATLAYLIIKYWDEVVEFFRVAWDGIKLATSDLANFLLSIFTEMIPNAAESMVDSVIAKITSMMDGIKAKVQEVWDWTTGLVGDIGDSISGVASGIANKVSSVASGIADTASSVASGIADTASDAVGFISMADPVVMGNIATNATSPSFSHAPQVQPSRSYQDNSTITNHIPMQIVDARDPQSVTKAVEQALSNNNRNRHAQGLSSMGAGN